jgi:hypothetical protein
MGKSLHKNSLRETLPLLMATIIAECESAKTNLEEYLNKYAEKTKQDEHGNFEYMLSIDHMYKVSALSRQNLHLNTSKNLLPRSFLVSLVSQYDAYLGSLIRVMFLKKPEILNSSEKNLTFSQLVGFSTIEDARKHIVEKEIEAVIRESHIEQIRWLEKKLAIPLTKDLDIWPTFVEITERRNLFVHTDGIVSEQYLSVCDENSVEFPNELKIGDCLGVSNDYFKQSCDCCFEFGIKLAHVIWRKLAPDDRESADTSLNQTCFELISEGEYKLALALLTFATETIKQHSSEEIFLYLIINKAQSLKWDGRDEECKALIATIDWSAKGHKYNLAKLVLLEEYTEAARLMKIIGPKGEVDIVSYTNWPLFKEFRKTMIFNEAFEEIFGKKPQIEGYVQDNEIDVEQCKD